MTAYNSVGELQNHANKLRPPMGLTLLEVLIALLVLSIGLVGVAALTIQSLQNTHSALYTSLASAAALDFEERLWIELGRQPGPGCPTLETHETGGYADDWTAGRSELGPPEVQFLGLPEFQFNATKDSEQTLSPIRIIEFTLGWKEGRLREADEIFEYKTRVPCRINS